MDTSIQGIEKLNVQPDRGMQVKQLIEEVKKLNGNAEVEEYFNSTLNDAKCYIDSDVSELVKDVLLRYGDSQPVMGALGKWLILANQWTCAVEICLLALSLGQVKPYVFNHIGMCYQHMNLNKLAELFFVRAIDGNPHNPSFYVGFSRFLQSIGQAQKARDIALNGLAAVPGSINLALLYSELLLKADDKDYALSELSKLGDKFEDNRIIERKISVRMALKTQEGVSDYRQQIKSQLAKIDKRVLLTSILSNLYLQQTEQDLMSRIEQHWLKLP